MAIISCPECGQSISSKAVSCPHCGMPLGKQEVRSSSESFWRRPRGLGDLLIYIPLIFVVIIILFSMCGPYRG